MRNAPLRLSALAPALAPALASLLLALAACGKNDAGPAPDPKPANATATATVNANANATAAAPTPSPGGRDGNSPIFHPEQATAKAPDKFKAKFATTKGDFVVEVTRAWSPNGADRFYNLVKLGFYDGIRFHRAIEGFMVQFGVSGDPAINGAWYKANIPDDPPAQSNKRGFVTFAMAGPGTRTTQIFINYNDKNARLDAMGFAPFGQVVEGMNVVDSLHKGYGELAPKGKGPDASRVQREGEAFLAKEFPELDKIKSAKIL